MRARNCRLFTVAVERLEKLAEPASPFSSASRGRVWRQISVADPSVPFGHCSGQRLLPVWFEMVALLRMPVNKARCWSNEPSAGAGFLATDKFASSIRRFCRGSACNPPLPPDKLTCLASSDSLLSAGHGHTTHYSMIDGVKTNDSRLVPGAASRFDPCGRIKCRAIWKST